MRLFCKAKPGSLNNFKESLAKNNFGLSIEEVSQITDKSERRRRIAEMVG